MLPFRFAKAAFLSFIALSGCAAALQCATCANNCPIKGQYLYNLDNIGMQMQHSPVIPVGQDGYYTTTKVKRFFTSPNHGHWVVTVTNSDDGKQVSVAIESGEKFTTNYIVTIYYASPDVGIATMDYYLNFPDVCNFETSAMHADNVLYVEVFQRADVAISQQLCKSADVGINQLKQVGLFENKDFHQYDLLYTHDQKFTARHTFQHPLVKLSVATEQTQWNSYVFLIPHTNAAPLKYWLRSGESCYYFLLPKDVPYQDVISVYL